MGKYIGRAILCVFIIGLIVTIDYLERRGNFDRRWSEIAIYVLVFAIADFCSPFITC